MNRLICAILVLMCFPFFSAADEITLQMCIDLSLRNNVEHKKSLIERKLDKPAFRAAWGQFLPRVQFGYDIDQSKFYNPTYLNPDGTVATYPRQESVWSTSIDPVTGYTRVDSIYSVMIDVPEGKRRGSSFYIHAEEVLFNGGRNYLNLKNSGISRDIGEANLKTSELRLRRDVIHAYANLVAASRRLDLSNAVVDQRRLHLKLANIRYESGSVTKRDVLRAEVELGTSLSDSINANLDIKYYHEFLNILVGLPVDTTFQVMSLPSVLLPEVDVHSLIHTALTNRSDLIALNRSRELRVNEHRMNIGDYLPRVSGTMLHRRSEQSGANVGFTLNPRNRYTQYGLSVSWLLFDRFNRSLRIQEADIRKDQAELSLIDLANSIKQQVRSSYDRLVSLHRQIQVAKQNVRLAEQSLKFETERYKIGSASVIELNAAQLSHFQAVTDQIRIETDYFKSYADLDYAIGGKLGQEPSD